MKQDGRYQKKEAADKLKRIIYDAAEKKERKLLTASIRKQMAAELAYISANDCEEMFLEAASISSYSRTHGYPLWVRGRIGGLYTAYLLNLVPENPIKYHSVWNDCLLRNHDGYFSMELNAAAEICKEIVQYKTRRSPKHMEYEIKMVPCLDFSAMHKLQLMTGVKYETIDVTDKKLFRYALEKGIAPMFDIDGYKLREILYELEPKTFDGFFRVVGMTLGSSVWEDNQRELLADVEKPLQKSYAVREDIYEYCVEIGLDRDSAFAIMRQIQNGKGALLPEAYKELLLECGANGDFLESISRVRYLFPRSHVVNLAHELLIMLWYQAYKTKAFEIVCSEMYEQ